MYSLLILHPSSFTARPQIGLIICHVSVFVTDNITSTVQHYMEINEADQQITYDENICYTNLNLQL